MDDYPGREQWRRVKGYIEYDVSSWGRVRARGRCVPMDGSLRRLMTRKDGRVRVQLNRRGKRVSMSVGRMVLTAFHPAPKMSAKATVVHIDGDLSNNRADNLQWGLCQPASPHASTNLLDNQVLEIRAGFAVEKISYTQLGEMYGVSRKLIRQIVARRCWKHLSEAS